MTATAKEISMDARAVLRRHFHMERRSEGFSQWKQCFTLFSDGFGGILLTTGVHGVTQPQM